MTEALLDEDDPRLDFGSSTPAVGTPVWMPLTAAGAGVIGMIALAAYAGGAGLALVFVGVIAVAAALSALRDVAAHTALLAGFTVVLGWLFCLTTMVIPALTSLSLTRSWFFTSEPMKVTIWEYLFHGSLELRRSVVFAAVLVPAVVAAAWMVVARSKGRQTVSTRGLLPLVGIAMLTCVPLIAAAWLKSTDPFRLLAPTMGGDGRNFLLHTQRIRVDSKYETIIGALSQGDFGPSLSALISKASGARGLYQITDQYSIAATYLLSASVIVASIVHIGIQMVTRVIAPQRLTRALAVAIGVVAALLGALLASNQWTMNEVFRSGFFSLYIAFAFTSLWVAMQLGMNLKDLRWWIGIAIVLVLLFCTYQAAAVLPGVVSAGYAAVAVWPLVRSRWRVLAPVVTVTALVVWWSGVVPAFVGRAQRRVMVPGSIVDTSDWFLTLLIPLGVGLVLLGAGVVRRIAMILVTIPLGTWLLLWFFTRTREARGETSIGYYGVKFLYLSLFLALVCVVAVFLYLLALVGGHRTKDRETPFGRRLDSLRRPLGVIMIGVGAAMVVTQAGPTATILTRSRTGWNQPSAQIAREVFGQWPAHDAIFLHIADPGNDRMANFWSPLFWSGDRWNWAYGNPTYDPKSICALMAPGPVTLVTAEKAYAKSLQSACPTVFDTVEVLR